MKTVIRIEHPKDGWGLFRSLETPCRARCSSFSFDTKMSIRHQAFNNPWCDNIPEFTYDHHCAFKSLDQLRDWLDDDWIKEIINEHGFRVYMIDLSDWLEGEMQVVYRKSDILQTKDISNLFL